MNRLKLRFSPLFVYKNRQLSEDAPTKTMLGKYNEYNYATFKFKKVFKKCEFNILNNDFTL